MKLSLILFLKARQPNRLAFKIIVGKKQKSSKKMDRGLQSRNLRNIDWDTAYRSRSARSARSPDCFSGYAKHENKKIRRYKNKKFPSLPLTLRYTENPHLINILLAKPYTRFLLFISLSNEFLDVCTFLFYFIFQVE